ncbi:unnamed protein product [Strongylus vulgaris]|uniref:Uncharacterized protein n=1 Tax=Strongylus vulgaris TaxID=40348 RepID=A0A3P7J315_STRVU|nr:unnamed protein product [Strongylus vulgaris]
MDKMPKDASLICSIIPHSLFLQGLILLGLIPGDQTMESSRMGVNLHAIGADTSQAMRPTTQELKMCHDFSPVLRFDFSRNDLILLTAALALSSKEGRGTSSALQVDFNS